MSFSRAPLLRFNEPKRRINPLGKSNSPTRTQQTAKGGRKSDNALAQSASVGKHSSSVSVSKEHNDKTEKKSTGKHPDQKLHVRRTSSDRSTTSTVDRKKEDTKTIPLATRAVPEHDARLDSPDKSVCVLSGDKRRGQLLEVTYQENRRKFIVAKRDLRDKQKVIDQLYSSLQEIQQRYKEVTGRELADVDNDAEFNETEGRSLAASSDGGSKRSGEDSDSTTLKAHSVQEEGVGSWMLNSLQNISEKYIELCKDVIKKRDDLISLVDTLLSSHEHGLTDELKRQVKEYQKEAEQFDEYMDLVRRLQLRSVASLGDALRDLVTEHERVKTELTEALGLKMKLEQEREESAAVARREAERHAAAQAELRARLAEVTEELGGERQRSQRLSAQTALLGQQLQQANVHVQETEARLKETTGQLMQVKDAARNNQVHMQNLATEKIDLLREYTEIKQKADEEVEEVVREMETRLEQVNKRLQEEMHMSQRLRQQNWSFRRLLVEADKKAKRNLMMLCHRAMQTESPCESDDETTDATASANNNRGSRSKGNDSSDSDFACESLATDSETPHGATPLRESVKSGDLTTDSSHKRLEEKGSHYPTEVTYTNPTSNEESSNESVCGLVMSDKPATGGGVSTCSFSDEEEDADGQKTVVETKHKPQVVKSMPAARKIEKIIVVRCMRSKDDKDKGSRNKTDETSMSSSMVFEDARETHSNDSFAPSVSEPVTDLRHPTGGSSVCPSLGGGVRGGSARPPQPSSQPQPPPPPPTPPSPPSCTVQCEGQCDECGLLGSGDDDEEEEEEEETDDVCRRLEEEKRRMREQRYALEEECRQIANEKAVLERDIHNASLMEKDLGERFQKEFSKMLMNELLPKEQEIEQLQQKVEELSAMVDFNKNQFSEYEGKMKELASSLSAPVVEGSQLALQDMVSGLRNHVSCMREALSAMRDRNTALEKALAAKGAEAAAQAQLARRQGLALQARDARLMALQATMRQRDKHAQKIEREVHLQTQQLSQLQLQLETRDLQLKQLTTMVHDLSEHYKSRGGGLGSGESGEDVLPVKCTLPPPPQTAQATSTVVPQLSVTTLQLLKPLPPPKSRTPEHPLTQKPSLQQQPSPMRPPSSTSVMRQQQQQQQQQQQNPPPQESSANPNVPSVHLLHPPQFLARQRQYIAPRRLNVSLATEIQQQQMQTQQRLMPQQVHAQQQVHASTREPPAQQQMEPQQQNQVQQHMPGQQMQSHPLLQSQQQRQPQQVTAQQIQPQQISTQQVHPQQQMEAQPQMQSHLQPHPQVQVHQHVQVRQQLQSKQQMQTQQQMEVHQQIQAQQKMQTQQLHAQQQLQTQQQLKPQHIQTQHTTQTQQIQTRETLKAEIYENLYQTGPERHSPMTSTMMSQIIQQCQVLESDVRYLSSKNSYPTADTLEQCAETEDSGIFSRHQLQEADERLWGNKSQTLLMVSSDSFSPIHHAPLCACPLTPPMSSQALNTRDEPSNSNIPLLYRMHESPSEYSIEHQNARPAVASALSPATQPYLPANINNSSYQDIEELRTHQQSILCPMNDVLEQTSNNMGELRTHPFGMSQFSDDQTPNILEELQQTPPFSLVDTERPAFSLGELRCQQGVPFDLVDLEREQTTSSFGEFLANHPSASYSLAEASSMQTPTKIGDILSQQLPVSYPQTDTVRDQTSINNYSFFCASHDPPNVTHALSSNYSHFSALYQNEDESSAQEREMNELSYVHNQIYSEELLTKEKPCCDSQDGLCHHKMSMFYNSKKSQKDAPQDPEESEPFVDAYNFFYNSSVTAADISEPTMAPSPSVNLQSSPIRYSTYFSTETENRPSEVYHPPESSAPEPQPKTDPPPRCLVHPHMPRINYEEDGNDNDDCKDNGLGANAAAAAVAAATVAMATVAAMRRSAVKNPSLHSVLAQTIASVAQKPSPTSSPPPLPPPPPPLKSTASPTDSRLREHSAPPPALHNNRCGGGGGGGGARPFSDVCKWVAEATSRAKEKTQGARHVNAWTPKATTKPSPAEHGADVGTSGDPLQQTKSDDRCDCGCVIGTCYDGGCPNETKEMLPPESSEDITNISDDMASEITALLQSRRARSTSAAMAAAAVSAPATAPRAPISGVRSGALATTAEASGGRLLKASTSALAEYWRERISSVGDRVERLRAVGLAGVPDAATGTGPPPPMATTTTTTTRGTTRIEVSTAISPASGQPRKVASPSSDTVNRPLKEEEDEPEDDFILAHPTQTLKMIPSPITSSRHLEKDAFRLQEPLSGLETTIFQMSSLHHRSDVKAGRVLLDPLDHGIPPKLRPSRKRTLLAWELPLRMKSSSKAPSDEEAEKELVVRELQEAPSGEECNRVDGRRRGHHETVAPRRSVGAAGEVPTPQIHASRSASPRGRTTRAECLANEQRKVTFSPLLKVSLIGKKGGVERSRGVRQDGDKGNPLTSISKEIVSLPLKWAGFPWPAISKCSKLPEKRSEKSPKKTERVASPTEIIPQVCKNCISAVSPFYSFIEDHIVDSSYRDSSEDDATMTRTAKVEIAGLNKFIKPESLWYLKPSCDMKKIQASKNRKCRTKTTRKSSLDSRLTALTLEDSPRLQSPTYDVFKPSKMLSGDTSPSPSQILDESLEDVTKTDERRLVSQRVGIRASKRISPLRLISELPKIVEHTEESSGDSASFQSISRWALKEPTKSASNFNERGFNTGETCDTSTSETRVRGAEAKDSVRRSPSSSNLFYRTRGETPGTKEKLFLQSSNGFVESLESLMDSHKNTDRDPTSNLSKSLSSHSEEDQIQTEARSLLGTSRGDWKNNRKTLNIRKKKCNRLYRHHALPSESGSSSSGAKMQRNVNLSTILNKRAKYKRQTNMCSIKAPSPNNAESFVAYSYVPCCPNSGDNVCTQKYLKRNIPELHIVDANCTYHGS